MSTMYASLCGNYEVPRTEFLVHQVKEIERKLIAWFKVAKSIPHSDFYYVRITNKGKWAVQYECNGGKEHILTEDEFNAAMSVNKK